MDFLLQFIYIFRITVIFNAVVAWSVCNIWNSKAWKSCTNIWRNLANVTVNSLSMCLKFSKQIYNHVKMYKENLPMQNFIFFLSKRQFFTYHLGETGIKLGVSRPMPPVVDMTSGVKVPCSTCTIRSLCCFFFSFLFTLCMICKGLG